MSSTQHYLITGANSDLGAALARQVCRDPNAVILLTSRTPHMFDDLVGTKQVKYLPGIDLTIESHLTRLSECAQSHFEDGFNVVNCAGYFPGFSPVSTTGIEEARRVFESNVLTVYAMAHFLIPIMCSRGGGHFIAFTSHTDYEHFPHMAAFTSAKQAVESLVKSIANEYSKSNVAANALALATLLTDSERKLKPRGDHDNWLRIEEVCSTIERIVAFPSDLLNGNTIHLFKHSKTFFHESFFDRIRKI